MMIPMLNFMKYRKKPAVISGSVGTALNILTFIDD